MVALPTQFRKALSAIEHTRCPRCRSRTSIPAPRSFAGVAERAGP